MSTTLRLAWAATKQLVRSREVLATMLLFPGALLVIFALFSDLRLETSEGATSILDLWVTGWGVLVVALGNGHAFLATIATYKSGGTLKRLAVTPANAGQLIVAEVVPRAAMGILTIAGFLALGAALGVNVQVGPALLALVPVMVLVTATGLSVAFVIAGLTRSPQNANALDSYVSFPLYLFTGAMFPVAAFPGWLEDAVLFIPYTGLIATVRGVALDGEPFTAFGMEMAIGVAWVAAMLVLAARAYRFVK